jgi:flagellar biosynthesis/type III secretory pathway M-ring protein FliF/YscJ
MKDVYGEEYLILKKKWLIFLVAYFLLLLVVAVIFLWSRMRSYTIIQRETMNDILKTILENCRSGGPV